MKKLFALMLSVMMLLSFAACGKDDDKDSNDGFNLNLPMGTNAGIQEITDAEFDIPTIGNDIVTPNDEYTDNLHNAVEVTIPSNSTNISIPRGTVLGDTYTSTAAGVRFTLPTGWEFNTDAEIAALTGNTADALGIDNFSETLANQVSVYDMMATNTTTQENVMVLYENTIKSSGKAITATDYADAVKTQLSALGYNVSYAESAFLGNTQFVSITASTTISGVNVEQKYFCRSLGDYIASVIVTSNGNTSCDELAALFY
ncbi:MAG: hypothetical protein IKJ83_01010 [Ruminococcus sp.]|nr:hypothetical protein [Ruminococcus sp.]